jgi:hypothetical protein
MESLSCLVDILVNYSGIELPVPILQFELETGSTTMAIHSEKAARSIIATFIFA